MPEQTPLIVPMTVEAFIVNSYAGLPEYVSSGMNYFGMINLLTNAQQGLFEPQDPANPAPFYGVYLKWRLPAAFTNGVQDSAGGRTVFPPAPNRWLVVRYGGTDPASRTATAWIVSSDQLNTQHQPLQPRAEDGAAYLGQPAPHEANQQIAIGVPVQLPVSGGWTDPGVSRKLTAVAPGNHAFASFQPSCNSVFSFVDVNALDVPDQTFSYMVAGWFSESDDDPLSAVNSASNPEETFTAIIDSLGWQVSQNDSTTYATATVASGFVDGVLWTADKEIPAAIPSESSGIGIAIGNTSTEALTALIQGINPNLDAGLLEALQLDMVENLDQTDGEAMLDQAIQGSFFKRYSGGYTWTITAERQRKHAKPPSRHELEKEAEILAALNAQQQRLDGQLRQLDTLRNELYVMWWKYANLKNSPPPSGSIVTLQQVQQQLDPTQKGSIARQIVELMKEVKNSPVPSGNSPKELQAAIYAYAAIHGLPVSRRLKRSSAPSFYEVNNPVILISGAGSTNIARTPKQVACRFPDELISTFVYGTSTFDNSSIPQPSFGNVNGPPAWWASMMQSLNVEFFLLDPNNATIIANAIGQPLAEPTIAQQMGKQGVANYPDGTLPAAVAQLQWTKNPWHPLLLRWAVEYTPIPYGAYGENWTFQDGQYAWNGNLVGDITMTDPQPSGLIVLTPTAAFNMQARVQAFINNNPGVASNAFQELLDDGQWDLLSQSLDGFNEQLLLGQPGVFLSPSSTTFHTDPTLPELLAGTGGYPPQLPPVPTSPPTGPTGFQLWRSGQLVLSQLTVIDEFGQSLDLITDKSAVTVFGPPEFQRVMTSNDALLDLASGTAIVSPKTKSQMTITAVTLDGSDLTVTGNNFAADATITWFGAPLEMTSVSPTQLKTIVSTAGVTGPVPIAVTAQMPESEKPSNPFILPPALLQPGQLDFSLVSAIDDSKHVGPGSNANPICGWVIPNILDNGLLAFDPSGMLLGELGIDISTSDQPAVTWNNNPFSKYTGGLPEIAKKMPHFGQFLLKLSEQSAAELSTFLQVIDDTLWTTLPSSASFDQNLAVFIGRPLAMVRAGLQFLLDGPPYNDPSWQFTFKRQQQVEAIEFGIQLGDVTQLEDGLIGYFTFDDYETFNVVQASGATSDGYLKLIGLGNYIRKRFDGKKPTYVSMLVDPRAAVNATTGILPAVTVSLPQELVSAALANMSVTFRVSGALTDEQPATTGNPTILLPTRREPGAAWKWVENDEQKWNQYPIAPNDTNARLSPVPPVLRSGLLQLSIGGELS